MGGVTSSEVSETRIETQVNISYNSKVNIRFCTPYTNRQGRDQTNPITGGRCKVQRRFLY